MAFDIIRLKKHGYPTIGISSADYKSLSKKNKIIFNAHNTADKKYTYIINHKKYSKRIELKAMYHGAVADAMLREGTRLSKKDKQIIYKDCKKLLG